jgi:hypothetical protein
MPSTVKPGEPDLRIVPDTEPDYPHLENGMLIIDHGSAAIAKGFVVYLDTPEDIRKVPPDIVERAEVIMTVHGKVIRQRFAANVHAGPSS